MRYIVRLGSVYIDVLVVITVSSILAYAFGSNEFSTNSPTLLAIQILVGLAVNLFSGRLGTSPGQWLTDRIVPTLQWTKKAWINFALGILALLDGLKSLVRWMQFEAAMPFMGIVPEGNIRIAICIVTGLFLILGAIALLRLDYRGRQLMAAINMLLLVSLALSWQLLPQAIEQMVVARRALQGLPVDPGRIEFMKAVYPSFTAGYLLLGCLLSLFAYSRQPEPKRD